MGILRPDERDCAVYTRPQVKQPRVEETDKNSRLDDIKYGHFSFFVTTLWNKEIIYKLNDNFIKQNKRFNAFHYQEKIVMGI